MALVNPGIALSVENFKVPNMLGMASEAESIQNKQVTRQAAQQEMRNADYAQAMKQSRDALAFVRTPDDYIAWSESLYQNPLLRDVLAKTGTTPEQSRARIAAELQQPGGFERLIQQSAATAAQLTDIMTGRLNTMAAERKATTANARNRAVEGTIGNIIGGQGGGAAPVTPSAQAFPVPPAPDTGAYEPGTPGAINQMYAQSRATPTPALNALTTEPTQTDQMLDTIQRLNSAAVSHPDPAVRKEAAARAKLLQDQYKFMAEQTDSGMKPSERFVPVGGNIYDRQIQKWDMPPTKQDVDELKPKLEKGERWNEETGRVEAVPGSNLYIKQSQQHAKSLQTYKAVNTKVEQINQKIDEILSPDNASAFEGNFGGYNAYASQMYPGENSNLRKKIDSFKSNMKAIGLELMRSGGSIGQMTEKEWPIVEQMLGAIDPVLGEKDARMQFERIKARVNNILTNSKDIYSTEWGDTQYYKPIEGAKALSAQDRQALDWANANPEDPRAAEIKRRLGQ